VLGLTASCRAIGDGKLKKWVIGTPDIAEFELTDDCEYLIAGCDGLWDVMDNDKVRCAIDRLASLGWHVREVDGLFLSFQVLAFVKEWQQTQPSIDGLAEALVEHAIDNLSSTDNISIIVVFLHNMTSDAWKSS
jgi:serine/threonine protein phosphatase PrpC